MSVPGKSKSAGARLVSTAQSVVEDFPVALAWSPDGTQLAMGGGEGPILLLDSNTGAARLLGEHAPGVLELAWQPKGALLASAGQDGSVRLWNTQGEDPAPRTLRRAARWPAGLSWRADGKVLAFAQGKDVLLFDAEGQPVRELGGHEVVVTQLLWRGREELVGTGNGALFVDRADDGTIEQFVLEGTPVTLALSPDSKVAASGLADGTVNFRYLNNRKRSRMSGYEGKVNQTAWSANSRYLATASTGASSVVLWEFGSKGPEGSDPIQLNGHEERIEGLAWQPAGSMLVSAGRDWRVALWQPGPRSREALDIQLLDGPAGTVAWSGDGKRLAVAQPSGKVRFFSLKLA
jgi:WD40 repeat protein